MPIIYNQIVYDDCQLGVWEMVESYDEMFNRIHFFEGEVEKLKNFKSTFRQIEWLTVRRLLREMRGEPTQIIYNDQRKPFLQNVDLNISISHSKSLTGIVLSRTKKLGLDLEYMTHNIEKVAHKFINNEEFITEQSDKRNLHLYIHWCAKEALYKLCDKQDINFRKNLTIEPFEPDVCGEIMGWIDNNFWHDKFLLRYFTIKGYVVVYCCK
jgi:4'-phosphopantetheinyl transferase EntD